MTGSQKIDYLQKKMKIHFLASVSPNFIRKYDEPLSVFLRRFSAKIQTKTLHAFSLLTVCFYEKDHFTARRLKSVNFSASRLRPHLLGKKWPFVYSNHVLYRFLAFWPSCSLTGYAVAQIVSTQKVCSVSYSLCHIGRHY